MAYAKLSLPVPLHPVDSTFDYLVPDSLFDQVQEGSFVEASFGRQKIRGVVWKISEETQVPKEKIKALGEPLFERPIFSAPRREFLYWLSQYYFHPLGEVCQAALPASIRGASKKKLVWEPSESMPTKKKAKDGPKQLNSQQQAAFDAIKQSQGGTHLLWGITGSGKTEVYLQLIEDCLAKGKRACVLVPEISLTPMMTKRFSDRFPGRCALFHSSQKATQQRKNWLEVFYGMKDVAIGPRSALFAPMEDLDLIIIDEEHDGSYKQEERLRYHSRDAASKLAQIYGARLVLGSATPSLESYELCKQGKAQMYKLTQRAVEAASLPEIEIIDLKKQITQKSFLSPEQDSDKGAFIPTPEDEGEIQRPPSRENFFISPQLESALEDCLKKEQQGILFLNRRGLGAHEFCKSCGFIPECPSCKVKLTPHPGKSLCHYCGYEGFAPKHCSSCESEESFTRVGIGTEALTQAIETLFPKARVLKMDRDSTTKRGSLEEILRDFSEHKADFLVGTQMVAKGHDFPRVTLVGIILADMGLSMPDFRAYEKSLHLLTQVSGRAGRGQDPGRVILQSFQPQHPIFNFIKDGASHENLERFYDEQLAMRESLNYPPCGKLIMLKFDGLKEDKVSSAARAVSSALSKASQKADFQVLGPAPSPIFCIRGRFRYQVLIRSKGANTPTAAVEWIYQQWMQKKLERLYQTRLHIDVDPHSMM